MIAMMDQEIIIKQSELEIMNGIAVLVFCTFRKLSISSKQNEDNCSHLFLRYSYEQYVFLLLEFHKYYSIRSAM